MSLYADDVMLYRIVQLQVDFLALQIDIDSLYEWTDENCLTFNALKCKYMVISKKWEPIQPSLPLIIKNSPLAKVESYKYLRVWILYTLNWSIQVQEVCKKARRQIGFLYRRFYQYASCSTFSRLYLTYVCPHLEYAVAIWDPHQQGLINALESVQKFALRASKKN